MSAKKESFSDRIDKGILIGDGAMGTMLYEQGFFLNTCFEELNLSRPEIIEPIHRAYIEAGCDFIETNTFGANALRLARCGLADRISRINAAAVSIAQKAAAGTDVFIAGSIGPSGITVPVPDAELSKRLRDAFAGQASALADAGIDFFLLETFSSQDELLIAIDAIQSTGLPIVAQMTVVTQFETVFGTPIDKAIVPIAAHPAVAAVGLNCSVGPSGMLEALKKIYTVVNKPISVQPNAGLPRQVEGRMIYMCTPEYMAEYAKRFFESGARIIGGCCGTTPEHIRQIAKAVRPLDRVSRSIQTPGRIEITYAAKPAFEPVPLEQKSPLGAKLAKKQPIICIELTPPKGINMAGLLEKARICKENGVDAINIPDGPRASARLSPLVTTVHIQRETGMETILHVCCRDKNIIGLQSDLLGIQAMDLRNVLLITGDPPKLGDYPDATAVFDLDSVALTGVVRGLNSGLDIAGNPLPQPLGLTIGVGANPVASDLRREIERFRLKAAAGAEYVITQPVFDTEMFFAFQAAVEDCQIPLIAGIWPFTSYKNAEFMANEVPGVTVPAHLLERMAKAQTREESQKIGIEIAHEMITELAPHVAGFAVSAPFGNVQTALATLGR